MYAPTIACDGSPKYERRWKTCCADLALDPRSDIVLTPTMVLIDRFVVEYWIAASIALREKQESAFFAVFVVSNPC